MIYAKENGRIIPEEDKVFALSGRAKAAIAKKGKDAVINATVGALLDDDGELVVLSSMASAIKELFPADYAEYAPISGTPEFKEAVRKALFRDFDPKGEVEICATPGGTGSLKIVIDNYSSPGDHVLTHDWCWANYRNICKEHGRDLATFRFFDDEGNFNAEELKASISELAKTQDQIVFLLNTPAHNPTGYSLSLDDWDRVIKVLNDAPVKVVLFLDIAYIDYAGDDDEVRAFIPKLAELKDNVFVTFGYSASKTLTAYGMRCGAIVCLAKTPEAASEFKKTSEYTARSTWSNCNRSAMAVMAKIYSDPKLLEKVSNERRGYRDMLLERGKAFEEALLNEGVKCVPFDAGFFATVECGDPAGVSAKLEEQDIFCLALPKGIRVSVASISKEKCVKCAKAIAALLK
jgi:aspartate/tyrosine/aromatic aminotransferase